MSSVCRKGRVPNPRSHLCATKGFRAAGATLPWDAVHRLASGIRRLAGDGRSGVDSEAGRQWGSSILFQPRGLSNDRCFLIYSAPGLKSCSYIHVCVSPTRHSLDKAPHQWSDFPLMCGFLHIEEK